MKSLNFTKKYILALSILGFLSILTYINSNILINLQSNDSKTINISGKQRMLSQRIYNAVMTFKMEILADSLRIMEKSNIYLTSLPMSKEVKKIYFEKPINFEQRVKEYISHGQKIKENVNNNNYVYVLNNSEELLKIFDELTSLYQKESENNVKSLKYFENYIFIISLLSLVFIGFFIFRPANRKLETITKEIIEEKDYSNIVIESNSNAIIAVDKDLKVKTFNKSAELIFGYSKEEMMEITRFWAETAMNLREKDLRMMRRLVKRQGSL